MLPDLDELAALQQPLIDELTDRLAQLGEIRPLSAISRGGDLMLDAPDLDARPRLAPDEMREIVDRAMLLLSSFYVHLAGKRALYANDPLQALRNLRVDLGFLSTPITEEQFHDRMTAIFVGLRDRHTNYYLPTPYRRTLAFLPFLIEAGIEPSSRRPKFLVTKIAGTSVADDVFRVPDDGEPPVEVTHLNGMPIEQVVARNGEQSSGGNVAARFARGIDRLTFQWLGLGSGPREDWVDVRFTVDGKAHERRFEWLAIRRPDPGAAPPGSAAETTALGHDLEGEWIRTVKQALFFRPAVDDRWTSIEDGVAAYRPIPGAPGEPDRGYLRIYSFEVAPRRVPAFLARIQEILRNAPPDGLIVDIRGNPGGNVLAAEGLLQLFSSRPVARQGVQFLNTPYAVGLAARFYGSPALVKDPASAATWTGAPFVVFPEMPRGPGAFPDEQAYQGQVVVIIDANCYSASEMFAAGMQDHTLARILGTHEQTGGGGGVVWSDELIAKMSGDRVLRRLLRPLPHGASFEVAVMRTTRVGEHAGAAVEDMGVVVRSPDVHKLTYNDILGYNADVLEAASAALAADPKPFVRATYAGGRFTLETRAVDRVDVYVDGVPVASLGEDQLGSEPLLLPGVARPPRGQILFRGVRRGEVVTSFRWQRPKRITVAPTPPVARPER